MLRTAFARQARLFATSTPRFNRGPVEVGKDALKAVDRTVSDAAVKGINASESAAETVKETLGYAGNKASGKAGEASGKASGHASELSGNASGKASELSDKASGKASELSGKANELAGQAKGKAHEVAGKAKGKFEEVKGKM